MSRDEDLLGSPAGSAMPLVISRVLCSQKIGWYPCSAAVGASGAGWNVGRLSEECDDALPSPPSSWWLQSAGLGWRAVYDRSYGVHMAVEEDSSSAQQAVWMKRYSLGHALPSASPRSHTAQLLAAAATPRFDRVDRPHHTKPTTHSEGLQDDQRQTSGRVSNITGKRSARGTGRLSWASAVLACHSELCLQCCKRWRSSVFATAVVKDDVLGQCSIGRALLPRPHNGAATTPVAPTTITSYPVVGRPCRAQQH